MGRRRYDDVVRFIASILFGTSFRQFHDVILSLRGLGCSESIAVVTTISFFAVYFRNVHGLIAYDLWAENSRYKPSFELRSWHIVENFLFGLSGAIVLPYILIYTLTGRSGKPWATDNANVIAIWLFFPILIYFIWDAFWLKRLRKVKLECYPPLLAPVSERLTSQIRLKVIEWSNVVLDYMPITCAEGLPKMIRPEELRAYKQILDFTILWFVIDVFTITWICLCVLGLSIIGPMRVTDYCLMYSLIAPIVLLLDYCFHVKYYFPVPYPTDSFYEFGHIWEYVLPDGLKYCNWGGQKSSRQLVDALGINGSDKVLELCCGQGGTLNLMPKARLIVGVDKSSVSIEEAKRHLEGKPIELLCADIHKLPYPNAFFTKILAQDGDAWMEPSNFALMSEISRVADRNCVFVYQSYVCSDAIPNDALEKTDKILCKCGYH